MSHITNFIKTQRDKACESDSTGRAFDMGMSTSHFLMKRKHEKEMEALKEKIKELEAELKKK